MSQINVPNLKTIGGSFNVLGNRDLSEKDFPSLESIGGDMHLAMSGFKLLPQNLKLVEGNIYLSLDLPESLKEDCLIKKNNGIVKGKIYIAGGNIKTNEDGNIIYEEVVPI
jgi:hypothetical protein